MRKQRRKLLTELKKIASYFRFTLSKIEVLTNMAFGLDERNKKLLVLGEKDKPFFKTIDVENIDSCAIKIKYTSISAGELEDKNINHFIDKIQLHISHLDSQKSVEVGFYD